MENIPNSIEDWKIKASERWRQTDLSERQYWLAMIAEEQNLPRMRFILTYKPDVFEKIPEEYQKILAEKWGVI